jgi:hypothetical protein
MIPHNIVFRFLSPQCGDRGTASEKRTGEVRSERGKDGRTGKMKWRFRVIPANLALIAVCCGEICKIDKVEFRCRDRLVAMQKKKNT